MVWYVKGEKGLSVPIPKKAYIYKPTLIISFL